MIKNINPEVLKALAQDINAALKAVADKHGISIATGSSTYGDANATMKLQICTIDADGNKRDRFRCALDCWSDHVLGGLKYGDKVTLLTRKGKETYTITGYNSRSGKLLALGEDGKTWLFPADKLIEQIDAKKASVQKA